MQTTPGRNSFKVGDRLLPAHPNWKQVRDACAFAIVVEEFPSFTVKWYYNKDEPWNVQYDALDAQDWFELDEVGRIRRIMENYGV